ncbi:tudor domain-containing protein 5-like [Haliotis cracherodii]|uniref:tudor domain-containing protein 5-like n=1 Tax=Haliotis cracherodii TaxID=6455 RepID=UPI0039EABC1C
MTDKAKLKEETKKQIRGLILSSPVGLTLRELRTDYENFIGPPIPYRQLGYNSIEDFLQDIPDTVCPSWEKGILILKAPTDPTTQHIERLVSRQKIPNKKKWAVLRKPPPRRNTYRPAPIVPSHLRNQIQNLFKSYGDGLPITHFETCFSKRFGYQLDYKKLRFDTLSDLLESIPLVVKLLPFQNGELRVVPTDFNSGVPPRRNVPPKANSIHSASAAADTVTNTVTSQRRQSQPSATYPVSQTFTNTDTQNKKPSSHNQSQTSANIPSLLSLPIQNTIQRPCVQNMDYPNPQMQVIQSGNMLYHVPVIPNVHIPTSVQYLPQPMLTPQMTMYVPQPPVSVQTTSHVYSPAASRQPLPTMTTVSSPILQEPHCVAALSKEVTLPDDRRLAQQSRDSKSCNSSLDSTEFMFDDDCGVSPELQEEIKQVLERRPKGIWASRLPFEYKGMFNKELPFKDLGFHSVVEFMSTLPKQLVEIQRPNKKGDFLLLGAHYKTEEHDEVERKATGAVPSKERLQSPKENQSFRESVRQVLQAHQEGILMQEFPAKYKEMTGRTLKDEIAYCGSLEKLCISLTDDVLQINYKGDGCLMLYAIYSDLARKFDQLLDTYQPLAVTEAPPNVQDSLPADAVGPGSYYTQLPLPDFSDYVEIFVSNIVSPGLFWTQFRERNNTKALERLMDDLEFYRSSSGNQYKVPESLLAVGQVVAVLFPEDQNWHRGIITSIRTMDFVDVYYVDYGNTCSVQKKTLRLLRSRYLKLPAQAVQARLSNIQPSGEKWTEQGKLEMLKICTNKPMIALITSQKSRVLSMCLTDTTSDVDLHVNDHLVHEGYAVFTPDELQTVPLYPDNLREVPDDALIYGITSGGSPIGGAAKHSVAMDTAGQPESAGSGSEGGSPRFVRPMELTPDLCVHVINWEAEPWIISAEISALFWEEDILRSMLQTRHMLVKKQVLSQSDYPHLFQDMLFYGVKSMHELKTYITIYALKGLPEILDAFDHPNTRLKARVEEILRDFDPNDLYWQGDDADMEADIQRELEETQLGVDELKLTLQALQFKRKRILQSLLSVTGSESEYVNQLHEVEMQISKTKELMEEVEATLGLDVHAAETFDKGCRSEGQVAMSPEKNIKTNRVAPLIVNPVSPQKNISTTPSTDTSNAQATTNLNTSNMMHQQQLLQSMMATQASMQALDPAMMSMMFPMMSNNMMQMPALGRGQNTSLLPGLQNFVNGGLPNVGAMNTGSQNVNSCLSSMNVRSPNMNPGMPAMGMPGLQGLMTMPNLQALMTSGQQVPAVSSNPRLSAPQATMGDLQGMPNMSNLQNLLGMSSVASGQTSNPQNMTLLPELLPLLDNLNIRGNNGFGNQ